MSGFSSLQTSLLDIRDQGIAVHQHSSSIQPAPRSTDQSSTDEAGFCLVLNNRVISGQRALKQSRYHRSHAFNQHWQLLNHNPIAPINPQVRHQADLVWHQLKQLQEEHQLQNIIIAYPSHYSTEQCQLLASVCQSLGLSLMALFNRSLLAVSGINSVLISTPIETNQQFWHLDIQWHQSIACQIEVNNKHSYIHDQKQFPETGIGQLMERLFSAIRHYCIEQSRFDIEYDAHIEQQVFDQIPQLVSQSFKQLEQVQADQSNQNTEFIELLLQRESGTFTSKIPCHLIQQQIHLWVKPLQKAIEEQPANWYRDRSLFLDDMILPKLKLLPILPTTEQLNALTARFSKQPSQQNNFHTQWITHWPTHLN